MDQLIIDKVVTCQRVLLGVIPDPPRHRLKDPVRIRVRIDALHPLLCRKRRLNGAVLRMRPEKLRSRVTAVRP
jgi:hypothetical protein